MSKTQNHARIAKSLRREYTRLRKAAQGRILDSYYCDYRLLKGAQHNLRYMMAMEA